MVAAPPGTGPRMPSMSQQQQQQQAEVPPRQAETQQQEQHAREVEEREAYEYWGYLFKTDKTGTDKLKSLLRGLKDHMNANYDRSDNPDLTPTQLAHFYRDLNGNYDQLFLGTPSESIAFIYKSLGCLHSLQPLPHSTAFTEPSVPALKNEGWIMWQTVQLLLGPEEHSSFLIEALRRWDVRDSSTGEVFPKILPRQCFPMEPDKHMVDWYEGVSERLRREADEEERQRLREAERAEVRRLQGRERRDGHADDETSVDSRGPALAYFRNPLYRHVDGRPTIVRHNSKRPQLSPRPTTIMDKGKEAAATMGHVIRNIGSPHLWDGRKGSSSRSRERDRQSRRRSSVPDNRYPSPGQNDHDPRHSLEPRQSSSQRRRHGLSAASGEDYDGDESGAYSPRPSSRHSRQRAGGRDPSLRHSRSHDPTPSQRESGDYFEGFDDPNRRRNPSRTPPAPNGIGPSFIPSASPLFAAQVARQPQRPHSHSVPDQYAPRRQYNDPPRHQPDRLYSRSPEPGRSRSRDERRSSRPPHLGSDGPGYPDSNGSPPRPGSISHGNAPPVGHYGHVQPGFPPVGAPLSAPPAQRAPSQSNTKERRSSRYSGSDMSGPEDRDRERRGSQVKQTRFAEGVDGRRYPSEVPWR